MKLKENLIYLIPAILFYAGIMVGQKNEIIGQSLVGLSLVGALFAFQKTEATNKKMKALCIVFMVAGITYLLAHLKLITIGS